ncbi:MAG: hypothetical protein A4E31_01130 [Methanomassiliicoccales archaeon PtaU1.Bin030]|nr:MAG: hypothetical protein A4E31_01130 [Methanomassiliicoccales archaeon PtaU1.Bin030]
MLSIEDVVRAGVRPGEDQRAVRVQPVEVHAVRRVLDHAPVPLLALLYSPLREHAVSDIAAMEEDTADARHIRKVGHDALDENRPSLPVSALDDRDLSGAPRVLLDLPEALHYVPAALGVDAQGGELTQRYPSQHLPLAQPGQSQEGRADVDVSAVLVSDGRQVGDVLGERPEPLLRCPQGLLAVAQPFYVLPELVPVPEKLLVGGLEVFLHLLQLGDVVGDDAQAVARLEHLDVVPVAAVSWLRHRLRTCVGDAGPHHLEATVHLPAIIGYGKQLRIALPQNVLLPRARREVGQRVPVDVHEVEVAIPDSERIGSGVHEHLEPLLALPQLPLSTQQLIVLLP